jgi:hypothetical protein
MPRDTRDEERQTEDEIARRKLGPRGVPGGPDTSKMTPQQKKNIPKTGKFDGHTAWSGRASLGWPPLHPAVKGDHMPFGFRDLLSVTNKRVDFQRRLTDGKIARVGLKSGEIKRFE